MNAEGKDIRLPYTSTYTQEDFCCPQLLFQTSQYKNALFVGYDRMGKPRYGALRSTFSRF